MKYSSLGLLVALVVVHFGSGRGSAAELVTRKTETGTVVGYKDTPSLPWTGDAFCVHDPDRPVPKTVLPRPVGTPLPPAPAPSDAIVLFDGTSVEQWQGPAWEVKEGSLCAGRQSLLTKTAFGSCQLHVEFATPVGPPQKFMNRGNSGVLFMSKYELQIFDSWHKHPQQIYPDGQAASIYGQTPPLANACMPAGEWQAYDIVFEAPVFEGEKLVKKGTVTMYHNGVLVHNRQAIMGEMAHRTINPYVSHAAKLPLMLQGHNSTVRFRNIWIREL